MQVFLTSQTHGEYRNFTPEYPGFNEANGFLAAVRAVWKPDSRVLFVASDPDDFCMVDGVSGDIRKRLEASGLSVSSFIACDHRNCSEAAKSLADYDAVFLSGGHVPTANKFYKEISLKEKLEEFDGILTGISAGSMNQAETVYVQPEMEGESDPSFTRFISGLGTVHFSIIPHYQVTKNDIVDGKRLFEDITYPDSYGHRFYIFVDGTYASKVIDKSARPFRDGEAVIHGEAYLLEDGQMTRISSVGGTYIVPEG